MPPRAKCLELSRLPRASTRLTKVNFQGTTPGSGINLITRHKGQYPDEYVDPTHPLAGAPLDSRLRIAPHWYSPSIQFYAFPKALLMRPTTPWPAPYPHRPFPALPPEPDVESADVSLQIVAFKSRLVLAQHLRYKIKRRLREAIRLIVSRGASVAKSPAGWKVVFREEDIGAEKWIMPNWTYLAVPSSELYKLPFAEYVRLMRNALKHLSQEIRAFDEKVQAGVMDWESYLSVYGRIKLEKERKAQKAKTNGFERPKEAPLRYACSRR
ncbi:hypothetical protein BC834DRAFT_182152 [Gloeopeniophorella convolvens]|nr:hypothetical protein BC834DRAFT_182152 [Gloeopeniophorella convolvens]